MHLYEHGIYSNNISAHVTSGDAAAMSSGSLVLETSHKRGQSDNGPSNVGQIVIAVKPLCISNSIRLRLLASIFLTNRWVSIAFWHSVFDTFRKLLALVHIGKCVALIVFTVVTGGIREADNTSNTRLNNEQPEFLNLSFLPLPPKASRKEGENCSVGRLAVLCPVMYIKCCHPPSNHKSKRK